VTNWRHTEQPGGNSTLPACRKFELVVVRALLHRADIAGQVWPTGPESRVRLDQAPYHPIERRRIELQVGLVPDDVARSARFQARPRNLALAAVLDA